MSQQHPITPPPPHLLKKFSAQAQAEANKRNGTGYLKTVATLCIEWFVNSQSTSNDRQIRSSEIEPPTELVREWHQSAAHWRPLMIDPTAAMSPGIVEEAKAAKVALSARIATALAQFTADTGLAVESLDVTQLQVYGGEVRYYVESEVRL
jgi:hypothetical protein